MTKSDARTATKSMVSPAICRGGLKIARVGTSSNDRTVLSDGFEGAFVFQNRSAKRVASTG